MRAYFSGVAPRDVTSIVVRDTERRVAKQVSVTGQTYRFDVAAETVGTVEFRDRQGREVGAVPVLNRPGPAETNTSKPG